MVRMVDMNINGDIIQVLEPDDTDLNYAVSYGTHRDNLEDARAIYLADKQNFFLTGVADRAIEKANKKWDESGKQLYASAMALFRMYGASDEDKQYAMKLMDIATKDADLRKQNMQKHFEFLLKREPENEGLRDEMRSVMLGCIHTVERMMNTQSLYLRYYEKDTPVSQTIIQKETKAAIEAEKIRRRIPEGCHYRPSYLVPKKITPPGERVPEWPEPINRVMAIPIEEKVYDPELGEFVLPEGYLSEDGLIDDKSVVWHPETREVEMGFVGGEREVWNYVKHTNTWDVWIPGSWEAEYMIRLYQQMVADLQQGLFKHKDYEDKMPLK